MTEPVPDPTPPAPEEPGAVPVLVPRPDGTGNGTMSAGLAWLALGAYGEDED